MVIFSACASARDGNDASGGDESQKVISDVSSMHREADGTFTVTCKDGRVQRGVTDADILANKVCEPPTEIAWCTHAGGTCREGAAPGALPTTAHLRGRAGPYESGTWNCTIDIDITPAKNSSDDKLCDARFATVQDVANVGKPDWIKVHATAKVTCADGTQVSDTFDQDYCGASGQGPYATMQYFEYAGNTIPFQLTARKALGSLAIYGVPPHDIRPVLTSVELAGRTFDLDVLEFVPGP